MKVIKSPVYSSPQAMWQSQTRGRRCFELSALNADNICSRNLTLVIILSTPSPSWNVATASCCEEFFLQQQSWSDLIGRYWWIIMPQQWRQTKRYFAHSKHCTLFVAQMVKRPFNSTWIPVDNIKNVEKFKAGEYLWKVSAEGEHRLILINLSAVFTSRIYDTMKSNIPQQPVHLDQSERSSLVYQNSKSKPRIHRENFSFWPFSWT